MDDGVLDGQAMIPEPSTLWLISSPFATLLAGRWRRR